jgi:hypothetical protein
MSADSPPADVDHSVWFNTRHGRSIRMGVMHAALIEHVMVCHT